MDNQEKLAVIAGFSKRLAEIGSEMAEFCQSNPKDVNLAIEHLHFQRAVKQGLEICGAAMYRYGKVPQPKISKE